MKATPAVPTVDLGEHVGEVLADRFLYHFVVRRYALGLLGDADEWGGLPILPSGGDQRGDRPHRSQ